MSLPLVQTMHPPCSIPHVLPQSAEGRGQWTILVECLLQAPYGTLGKYAAIETDLHVVKPGHSLRLVDREGAVFFRVWWSFSPPLILAPLNHSLCRSIPWFPSLCCRLNFCFFHFCFQMVKGSRLQQLAHKICNNLVHFPGEF